MAEPVVLGVLLRVETRGYAGPPPRLPKEPIKVEEGGDGLRRFTYDLSPKDPDLSVEDVCLRLGSRLGRMLNSDKAALPQGQFAAKCTLEFGVLASREGESFSYAWPLEFLQILVDADVALNVSHYLPSLEDEDDESGDDDY
jgi:hypothetical protein